ncbi:hypothetical protein L6R46_04480 [Myxococcota bacterium]|jgi:hypothetical protein|nr:hypothetical protein [Myxococcota bacterium]
MRTIPEADIVQLLNAVKGLFPNGAGEAVDHWVIQQGPDSTNDPAIWVWVILKDALASRVSDVRVVNQIRDLIQGCLYEELDVHFDFELYVYVRFRTVTEQAHLEDQELEIPRRRASR